jgi:hypothetical protein
MLYFDYYENVEFELSATGVPLFVRGWLDH